MYRDREVSRAATGRTRAPCAPASRSGRGPLDAGCALWPLAHRSLPTAAVTVAGLSTAV